MSTPFNPNGTNASNVSVLLNRMNGDIDEKGLNDYYHQIYNYSNMTNEKCASIKQMNSVLQYPNRSTNDRKLFEADNKPMKWDLSNYYQPLHQSLEQQQQQQNISEMPQQIQTIIGNDDRETNLMSSIQSSNNNNNINNINNNNNNNNIINNNNNNNNNDNNNKNNNNNFELVSGTDNSFLTAMMINNGNNIDMNNHEGNGLRSKSNKFVHDAKMTNNLGINETTKENISTNFFHQTGNNDDNYLLQSNLNPSTMTLTNMTNEEIERNEMANNNFDEEMKLNNVHQLDDRNSNQNSMSSEDYLESNKTSSISLVDGKKTNDQNKNEEKTKQTKSKKGRSCKKATSSMTTTKKDFTNNRSIDYSTINAQQYFLSLASSLAATNYSTSSIMRDANDQFLNYSPGTENFPNKLNENFFSNYFVQFPNTINSTTQLFTSTTAPVFSSTTDVQGAGQTDYCNQINNDENRSTNIMEPNENQLEANQIDLKRLAEQYPYSELLENMIDNKNLLGTSTCGGGDNSNMTNLAQTKIQSALGSMLEQVNGEEMRNNDWNKNVFNSSGGGGGCGAGSETGGVTRTTEFPNNLNESTNENLFINLFGNINPISITTTTTTYMLPTTSTTMPMSNHLIETRTRTTTNNSLENDGNHQNLQTNCTTNQMMTNSELLQNQDETNPMFAFDTTSSVMALFHQLNSASNLNGTSPNSITSSTYDDLSTNNLYNSLYNQATSQLSPYYFNGLNCTSYSTTLPFQTPFFSFPSYSSLRSTSSTTLQSNYLLSPYYSYMTSNSSLSGSSAVAAASLMSNHSLNDPHEMETFAEKFKQRRIKLGITQADVGQQLTKLKLPGVGSLSQSTICRFESLTLSQNNMIALKPILQAWLEQAEAESCANTTSSILSGNHYGQNGTSINHRLSSNVVSSQMRVNFRMMDNNFYGRFDTSKVLNKKKTTKSTNGKKNEKNGNKSGYSQNNNNSKSRSKNSSISSQAPSSTSTSSSCTTITTTGKSSFSTTATIPSDSNSICHNSKQDFSFGKMKPTLGIDDPNLLPTLNKLKRIDCIPSIAVSAMSINNKSLITTSSLLMPLTSLNCSSALSSSSSSSSCSSNITNNLTPLLPSTITASTMRTGSSSNLLSSNVLTSNLFDSEKQKNYEFSDSNRKKSIYQLQPFIIKSTSSCSSTSSSLNSSSSKQQQQSEASAYSISSALPSSTFVSTSFPTTLSQLISSDTQMNIDHISTKVIDEMTNINSYHSSPPQNNNEFSIIPSSSTSYNNNHALYQEQEQQQQQLSSFENNSSDQSMQFSIASYPQANNELMNDNEQTNNFSELFKLPQQSCESKVAKNNCSFENLIVEKSLNIFNNTNNNIVEDVKSTNGNGISTETNFNPDNCSTNIMKMENSKNNNNNNHHRQVTPPISISDTSSSSSFSVTSSSTCLSPTSSTSSRTNSTNSHKFDGSNDNQNENDSRTSKDKKSMDKGGKSSKSKHSRLNEDDNQLNDKNAKRKRTSIAAPEKRSLEQHFLLQPRPSGEKIAQIAQKLSLKKSVVRVWFCNQRQKQKRMKFAAATNNMNETQSNKLINSYSNTLAAAATPNYSSIYALDTFNNQSSSLIYNTSLLSTNVTTTTTTTTDAEMMVDTNKQWNEPSSQSTSQSTSNNVTMNGF
ncbi:hypothetical protein SNEBB_011396 [Seison nebaliae]|nr:hypothetical protein SNEBB_011396 [Seison nebaliae]